MSIGKEGLSNLRSTTNLDDQRNCNKCEGDPHSELFLSPFLVKIMFQTDIAVLKKLCSIFRYKCVFQSTTDNCEYVIEVSSGNNQ